MSAEGRAPGTGGREGSAVPDAPGQPQGRAGRAGRGHGASARVVAGTCGAWAERLGSGRAGLASRGEQGGETGRLEPARHTQRRTVSGIALRRPRRGRPGSVGLLTPSWVGRAFSPWPTAGWLCFQGHDRWLASPSSDPQCVV